MRRRVSCVVTAWAMLLPVCAWCGINDFLGEWEVVENTDGIMKLRIFESGNGLRMRVGGPCHSTDCDWREAPAQAYAPSVSANLAEKAEALSARYDPGFATKLVLVRMSGADHVRVEVLTMFKDNSGRTPTRWAQRFRRPGAPPEEKLGWREDCLSFNPETSSVAYIRGRWKLVDGSHWLVDFGDDMAAAQQALQTVKQYGTNQTCFVGRPDASLQYLLVSGEAPTGAIGGENCVWFDPAELAVEGVPGSWSLVQGNLRIGDFAETKGEARQARAIIRKYGFQYLCGPQAPGQKWHYLRR